MKELNTKSAGYYAYGAAINAQITNTKNKHLHTAANLSKADTVRDLLHTAFAHTSLYINYRKRFISVTINNMQVRDALTATGLIDFFSSKYTVVKTQEGVIVRIA
jgi:hypothetical protein